MTSEVRFYSMGLLTSYPASKMDHHPMMSNSNLMSHAWMGMDGSMILKWTKENGVESVH
jgi:hypothetical protein